MRVTYSVPRHRRKKKLLKQAKGFRGGRSKLYRTVKETLVRAGVYAYRDRKCRKRNFRRLWIQRINAAVRSMDLSYSQFIFGLKRAGVEINRKWLSEMAIHDPKGFAQLVETAKANLP